LLLLLVLPACAQQDPIQIRDVWARDTVGSVANAAVYMTISSKTPDRLLGASTPVAKSTSLMTMQMSGDAMEMADVKDVAVPAGKPVSLDPGGLHVWLSGLNRPLAAGQTFPLVLRFEKTGERRVTVSVIAPAAQPPKS
jgi:hypothetical protein